MKEFSKWAIKAMVWLWFAGAVFGAVVIVVELIATLATMHDYTMGVTVHLPELLAYIGAPVGCGITAYLLKSAFENREKIKQNYIPDYNSPENFGGNYEHQFETEIDIP
jgi:hypothetical protein